MVLFRIFSQDSVSLFLQLLTRCTILYFFSQCERTKEKERERKIRSVSHFKNFSFLNRHGSNVMIRQVIKMQL